MYFITVNTNSKIYRGMYLNHFISNKNTNEYKKLIVYSILVVIFLLLLLLFIFIFISIPWLHSDTNVKSRTNFSNIFSVEK